MIEDAKIMVICDNDDSTKYLNEQLVVRGGYTATFASTNERGIDLLRESGFDIVIALMSGSLDADINFIKDLKAADPNCVIIAFLEKADTRQIEEFLKQGAYDFITRPINFERFFFLVDKGSQLHSLLLNNYRSLASLKEQNAALEKKTALLSDRIEDSTGNLSRLYEDLRSTYMRTIKSLAQAIDARDHYTHSHSESVARYAVSIATEMGMTVKEIETIREACELHDLGKIGVEDSILGKPGSLTKDEWEMIKKHPVIGAQILGPLTFLESVIDLVRQHHEHYDGTGYPEGRKGEEILLGARIINLADAYDSMRSARPYRKVPLSKEEAVMEIMKHRGTQFDPKVVDAFLRIQDNLEPGT